MLILNSWIDEPHWTISRWQYTRALSNVFSVLSTRVSKGLGQNCPMAQQQYDQGKDAPCLGNVWFVPLTHDYLRVESFKVRVDGEVPILI